MASSLSSCMPKLPSSTEWQAIQKKVAAPLLWLLLISTVLILFITEHSNTLGKGVLSIAKDNSSLRQLVQSPPDSGTGSAALHGNGTSAAQGHDVEELCDVSKGKWVREPRGATYTNLTCPMMLDIKNCGKYGKDQSYVFWRWQPDGCDLPRFEPETFLNIVRGKTMAIIGDSLARDHMESLLCLLSQAEVPNNTFRDPIDKYVTWRFPAHDFTLMVMWTEFMVEASPRIINGTASSSFDIHLDKVSDTWTKKLPGVDYAVISGGNWFFRDIHLYEGGNIIGCINCRDQNLTLYEVPYAIRRVLRTTLEFISSCKECEGLVAFLRTFTGSHFEKGSWFDGGYCNRTQPLDESEISHGDVAWEIRKIQVEEIARVRQQEREAKVRIGVLDVTSAMMLRADGHPGEHWTKERRIVDCLHWCLPGPVDMWSELLLATLKKDIAMP